MEEHDIVTCMCYECRYTKMVKLLVSNGFSEYQASQTAKELLSWLKPEIA